MSSTTFSHYGSGRTGNGPIGAKVSWTATNDFPNDGGWDVAGALRVQGASIFYGGIQNGAAGTPIPSTSLLLTSSGNANQQVAKARVYDEVLIGMTLSATTNFAVIPGRAGIVSQISVGALTKPSATASVAVQIYKNTTATPLTASFDLNSLTNNVAQVIPLTGSNAALTFTATDMLFIAAACGASLNGMQGGAVSIEALTTPDY